MKVFVFREGKRYGPYSVEKLREFLQQGNFTVEDLVCLDGENWQKISEVPGLTLEEKPVALESSIEEQPQVEPTPHLEVKPDEVLPEAVEEVQAVQEESSDSTEGAKNKRKILVWSGIGSFVTALAVGLFFFFSDNGGSSDEESDGDYFTKPIEESNRFQKGATIVAALLGEVSVTDPSDIDGNSSGKRSAREGEVLLPGSLIETGSESEVILLFSNGHLATLGSDAKMSVDAFVQEEFDGSEDKVGELKGEVSPSRMKLDLDFGEMIVDVKKLNKESSLVITTNVGVVGIRGTRFGVTSENGSVAVSVLEGLVEFLDEKKVVHAVKQEKRLEAEKGEEPEIVALSNEDKERMEAAILSAKQKTTDFTVADLTEAFDEVNPKTSQARIVILLTDGKDDPPPRHSPLVFAEGAKEDGIKIYTIAVGQSTRTRTYIYDRRTGDLLRNSSGNPEVTIANYPVDKEVLRKVAETTGAKFFEAGDEARLREIYDEITSLEGQGGDISLAVDLSASMLALDMSENATQPVTRLDLVKRVIEDFVTNRENTRIGLVGFSVNPYLLNPLTNDKDRLMANLQRLRIGFTGQTGTNIGVALAGSINCLLGPDAATANRDNFIYVRLLQEARAEESTAGAGLLIADEALEAALVKALKKTKVAITASDLATLESLDASNAKIRSLSGLEHATKLTKLQLDGNQITNLTPLAKLTNLTELAIYHNPVPEEQIAMLRKALPNCVFAKEPNADVASFTPGQPWAVPSVTLEMLWVEPGMFEMGSPTTEAGRGNNETPYTVTLTSGFYLGKHEVTQTQWEKVMGSNPSKFKGADRPVEEVSWTDVTSFCEKLTEVESKAGRLPAGMAYQLPTEAQWEYACRAGTTTAYSWGNSITVSNANYSSSGIDQTRDVGKYPANPWGFHDMHGNVWEWCADWVGDYPTGAVSDPVGPADGSSRAPRGGSWNFTADIARSADRHGRPPARTHSYLGFRLSLRPASN